MSRTYENAGAELGRLVDEKQAAYGNSFSKSGDILRILYPNGIQDKDVDDVLTITRILDKIFRIATRKSAFSESPWKDIAGYALLASERDSNG